jgi:peptidoglycan/LPS O-acetylase OafA/YrhL
LVFAFILLAIGCKAVLYLQHPASQFSKFPISQFDGFGLGSLLALFWRRGISISSEMAFAGFVLCWSISFFLKWEHFHFYGKSLMGQVLPFYFTGCAFLIYLAAKEMKGFAGFLFGNPVSVYLGKISYGLYLYHLFVPGLIRWTMKMYGIPVLSEAWMWVLYSLLTLTLTSLSWYLIEQPVNQLKDRFRYESKGVEGRIL